MILLSFPRVVATLPQLITMLAICFFIAYLIVFIRIVRDRVRDNLSYKKAIYKRSAPLISITIILIVIILLLVLN